LQSQANTDKNIKNAEWMHHYDTFSAVVCKDTDRLTSTIIISYCATHSSHRTVTNSYR